MKTLMKSCCAVIITIIFLSNVAIACLTSPANIPYCSSFVESDAIFVGTVKESEPFIKELEFAKKAYEQKYNRLKFEVTKVFKGEISDSFEAVYNTTWISSCGSLLDIKPGQTWIIFAKKDYREPDFYVTSSSFLYDTRKEANRIHSLELFQQGESDNGIYGQIRANYPLSSISRKDYKVTAEGNGQKFAMAMDEYGRFTFSSLSPGTYKIKMYLPFAGFVRNYNRTVVEELIFDEPLNLYTYELNFATNKNKCNYFSVTVDKEK